MCCCGTVAPVPAWQQHARAGQSGALPSTFQRLCGGCPGVHKEVLVPESLQGHCGGSLNTEKGKTHAKELAGTVSISICSFSQQWPRWHLPDLGHMDQTSLWYLGNFFISVSLALRCLSHPPALPLQQSKPTPAPLS